MYVCDHGIVVCYAVIFAWIVMTVALSMATIAAFPKPCRCRCRFAFGVSGWLTGCLASHLSRSPTGDAFHLTDDRDLISYRLQSHWSGPQNTHTKQKKKNLCKRSCAHATPTKAKTYLPLLLLMIALYSPKPLASSTASAFAFVYASLQHPTPIPLRHKMSFERFMACDHQRSLHTRAAHHPLATLCPCIVGAFHPPLITSLW